MVLLNFVSIFVVLCLFSCVEYFASFIAFRFALGPKPISKESRLNQHWWSKEFNASFPLIKKRSTIFLNIFLSLIIVHNIFNIVSIIQDSIDENKKEQIVLEEKWKLNHCPVFKSECGSKHKYSCERKAQSVGRIQDGSIFVQSYPTC